MARYTGFCPGFSEEIGTSYGRQTHNIIKKNLQNLGNRLSRTKGYSSERCTPKLRRSDSRYSEDSTNKQKCATCKYNNWKYYYDREEKAAEVPSEKKRNELHSGKADSVTERNKTSSYMYCTKPSRENRHCAGRCQENQKHYLNKYEKENSLKENPVIVLCIGAHEPREEKFHELNESRSKRPKEKTTKDRYQPRCKKNEPRLCCHISFSPSVKDNKTCDTKCNCFSTNNPERPEKNPVPSYRTKGPSSYCKFTPDRTERPCSCCKFTPNKTERPSTYCKFMPVKNKVIPKYTGFVAGIQWSVGETFGQASERLSSKNANRSGIGEVCCNC